MYLCAVAPEVSVTIGELKKLVPFRPPRIRATFPEAEHPRAEGVLVEVRISARAGQSTINAL